ncbi:MULTISPECIES: type IV secretory system conjugative DNA transfer family protein [unclassified Microbacterium]|uniref:type IV secretory system conjugative DNA transfer family protein n=1 Tax=unclassified Microbacterium TaxID=2609290 RepID=UPI00214AC612|nr:MULTISPECIES: type IV secretory system conjugative DNA transfer family protein [unclassified Microbacterium]MCR2811303.1 TraM recognition domain-containing protein [Microbacterium sp. zg.B185]WIM19460.1 TraM recognition domain-containing protein [Microbacterium sp. zg-B185]
MNEGVLGKALAGLIGAAFVLSLLFAFLAQAVTWAICQSRPTPTSLFSGLWLAVTGDPTGYTAPAGCAIPVLPIRVADLVAVLLLGALGVGIGVAVRRYRQSDQAFIADLRTRPGFAPASEVRAHLSAKAVLRRASQLRPDLARPAATDVGWRVGSSRGTDVYVSIEDSVALEGPPRSGKGYRVLISAIVDWSGPLITTSTTNDNLTATMRMRQQRGTVHVFDPQGLSGIRHPMRVNPIVGCEDPLVAMQRGTAIITGTALGASTTNGEWAQASGVVLGRLLHAAAVGNQSIAEVYNWGTSPAQARDAVDILRNAGAPGWGDNLEATISGDEKLVSSIWFGVQGAVAPLAVPQIRATLMPNPGDAVFDPNQFLDGANTLYLLGSSSGAAAMGGWLSAVLDDIVEVARTRALASPGSRLTHPLGLILDEIVNMFRWGNLPRIMADGGGRGICTFVVLQALSQAETSWSRAEADTIWAAATAKVLLGGASHVDHLRDIEALLGSRDTRRSQKSWSTQQAGHTTSEQHERRPLMSVDEIRRMPQTLGLLAYRNRRGVLLDLSGWDQRRDARTIALGKQHTEREQRDVFHTHTRPTLPHPTGEAVSEE